MDERTEQPIEVYTAILNREQEAEEPRFSAIENNFQRLNWFGYGWLVVAIVVGLSWAIYILVLGRDFSYVLQVFVKTTVYLAPFHIFNYTLLFKSNWRSIWSNLTLGLAVQRLGYKDILEAPWRTKRAERRIVNALTLAAGPFMWGWGLFFTLVELFLSKLVPQAEWQHPAWYIYLCSLYTLGLGAIYVVLHLYRQAKERLEVVQELRNSLDDALTKNAIAEIERKQIWLNRVASLKDYRDLVPGWTPSFLKFGRDSGYFIQKTRSVRDYLSSLDDTQNLLVQKEIEILANDLKGTNTTRGEDPAILWRPIPQTLLELGFSVDKDTMRICIVELRKAKLQDSSSQELNKP